MTKQNYQHEDRTQQTSNRQISPLSDSWRSLSGFSNNWQIQLFSNSQDYAWWMLNYCERLNLPGFRSSWARAGERHFWCWFLSLPPPPQPSSVSLQCTKYRAAQSTPELPAQARAPAQHRITRTYSKSFPLLPGNKIPIKKPLYVNEHCNKRKI